MDITWDIEANNLLNSETIDYCSSPYKLKDSFAMHCIVVEEHQTGKLIAFYDGDDYIFDGRKYEEEDIELGYSYILENYIPVEYEHRSLNEFPNFIKQSPLSKVVAHNGINYDWLVCKLYFGMDYTVEPDSWAGNPIIIEDTLVISKTQNPDRFGGHSLDKLSEKVGLRKIDFRPYCKDDDRFKKFAADMLYYCIRDVQVNTKVYFWLKEEAGNWNWKDAISLEKSVAEIITRQEHRGFKFDKELAERNIEELDRLLQERREKVEPVLPLKSATKTFMKDYIPPVKQFLKTGEPSSYMVKFAEKLNAKITGEVRNYHFEFEGKSYPCPLPLEPLVTTQVATIDDTTHIKEWLVKDFGWQPSEYKERDLSVNSKKEKLSREKFEEVVEKYVEQTLNSPFCEDRCDFLETTPSKLKEKLLKKKEGRAVKVLTNPSFTVGQEKEICPNLELLAEKFPYARDVVEYLTYKHRRNSILGGGLEWDEEEEAEKGYMAYIREDGRIATPADTCGAATSRFKHRVVANIPRCTSLYGKPMRAQFGVEDGYYQLGYDFDSLEAREEAHYCVPMDTKALTREGWKDYYQIKIGDEVLGYNEVTKTKQWTKVEGVVKYSNAKLISTKFKSHEFLSTPDHRWFVQQRGAGTEYKDCVKLTRELNTGSKIIMNAPMDTTEDLLNNLDKLNQGKYEVDWSKKVLQMSQEQRKTFLEGFMIADGYWHTHNKTPVWKWAQNEGELFEAALLCSYLVHDGTMTVADNSGQSKVKVVTLCHNSTITGQRMIQTELGGLHDVWCLQTQLGSWVMRQGNSITITGNCYRYEKEPKEYCKSLLLDKPNDVHTQMAKKISVIINREFNRSPAKSVKYAATYGATPAKISKTIGEHISVGTQVYDAFWQAAAPLSMLKDKLKLYWETIGQKKFILGIDGRKVPTRSAHAILNSLFQSGGVICAKRAMVIHDRKLKAEGLSVDFFTEDWNNKLFCQQLIAYHDEAQSEVSSKLVQFKIFKTKEDAQSFKESQDVVWSDIKEAPKGGYFTAYCRAGELAVQAVREAGEYYRLNVDLTAGYIVGRNWAECH